MRFLKRLFKLKPPVLSGDLQVLQSQAESTVRRCLADGKAFPMFAMAMRTDGEVVSMVPSGEFDDPREAFASVVGTLMGMARDHAIRASVLVTQWEEGGGAQTAVFDLEQRGGGRVLVLLPFRASPAGVTYDPASMQHAMPKLF